MLAITTKENLRKSIGQIASHQRPWSIMVCDCNATNNIGRHVLVSEMMNDIKFIDVVEKKMLPRTHSLISDDNWTFQDHNVPCHRDKNKQHWYIAHKVERKDWPAQSPDLNPIKNWWYGVSCLISTQTEKEATYQTSYCGIILIEFT